MTTTGTPRTDASLTEQEAFVSQGLLECCRTLERELTLQKEITKGWLISRDVILEERDKLQAEVERLKELVNESILEKSNLSIALVNCQENLRRAKMEAAHLFWEELERELDEAQAEAEVERLTKKLSITEDELADAREWLDERYKATSEADDRAEKAEAEVERLRAFIANELQNKNSDLRDNLSRLIEFSERYTTCRPDCPADHDGPLHCTCGYQKGIEEVWALRKALNPTDK